MTPLDANDPRHDDDRNGGPEGARQREPLEHHHSRKIPKSGVASSSPNWVPASIRIQVRTGERHIKGVARWPLAVHEADDALLSMSEPRPWVITHQPSGRRLLPLAFRTAAAARQVADSLMQLAGSPGFTVRDPAGDPDLITVITETLRAHGCSATLTPASNPRAPS